MLENIKIVKPSEIEKKSMEMITEELGERKFPEYEEPVVKRCIHTSADFDYANNLIFSEDAARQAIQAIRDGASIITDTRMAASGINKKRLAQFGGQVYCFMDHEDVAQEAKERGCTRAVICMERGAKMEGPVIFAIGNAPTALIHLYELIQDGKVDPVLVIGVPVGFVNVIESKELFLESEIPHIIAKGRKGGSTIAAAICNALIYQA
ncbi:precorrin-8X methylmutase [Anaerostipes sp. 992a]|uniref:precorrin-8X methylmutase n=1 Tax=Anaerostipes sp. 992a TaxID=1261637 RepID=UPI000950C758|nr:precorrin-8X methylmutase [Anaerostipes sp. 992a]OLR62661.1 precorrin-8X methylmutase [Anaerostipes sp. 992a]